MTEIIDYLNESGITDLIKLCAAWGLVLLVLAVILLLFAIAMYLKVFKSIIKNKDL